MKIAATRQWQWQWQRNNGRNDNNVANNGLHLPPAPTPPSTPPPSSGLLGSCQGDIIISVSGPRTSFISFKFSLLLCVLKGFLDKGDAT